ncbi:MAG: zf-HC2 domain-containing protein [Armatimonadetes bacterium]|nr:zf-HC2 domain-containing protein [Armatimonadota bacterium]
MGQVKCGWARRRKWRYLDGTLPAPQKRQVEAHLQVCIPCRVEFTQAQEALNALAAGKPLTPEQQRALQRPKPALTPSRAAAVAILALLLGAGVYLWRVQGEALLERLTARGVSEPAAVAESAIAAPTPAPTEPEPAVRPEPAPLATPPAEPKPVEVAPKPAETPPRAAPPAPTRRATPRRPAPPRRASQPPKQPAPPATAPPEGTVEVYDAEGNLIQRKRLQEKR